MSTRAGPSHGHGHGHAHANAHAHAHARDPFVPAAPAIPLQAVQSLIPRLTTTINDIDTFSLVLAQGEADGSLPSWDALLQRYSLLMGGINALSAHLARAAQSTGPGTGPGPGPTTGPAASSAPRSTRPALDTYLVHPLNALPSSSSSTSTTTTAAADGSAPSAPLDPIALETFFQALNTQALPVVQDAQADALAHVRRQGASADADVGVGAGVGTGSGAGAGPSSIDASASGAGASAGIPWSDRAELKLSHATHGDGPIRLLRGRLDQRLSRESDAAQGLVRAIRAIEDEYNWVTRLDAEADAEDGGKGHGDGNGDGDGDGEDDDLFKDDEDEAEGKAPPPSATAAATATAPAPNPRPGWSVADYVRFMDTGKTPAPCAA